eukprot:2842481-Pyramimonas_sp.AAC.1
MAATPILMSNYTTLRFCKGDSLVSYLSHSSGESPTPRQRAHSPRRHYYYSLLSKQTANSNIL